MQFNVEWSTCNCHAYLERENAGGVHKSEGRPHPCFYSVLVSLRILTHNSGTAATDNTTDCET